MGKDKNLKNNPESNVQKVASNDFFLGNCIDNALFEALVSNNQSIILFIESDSGKIAYANKAACNFYGYTREEIVGMCLDKINLLALHDIKEQMATVKTGKRNYFNFQHKLKSGAIKHVEVYSSPIHLNNMNYLYSIIHDITERVQAEELNKILKHSLDVYTDGIYWMNNKNEFIYVNEAGGKAFGCKPDDLLGKSLYDVNPTTTPESLADLWNKLRNDGIFIAETVHRRFDGSEFFVEIRTVYFQYEGKEYNCGYARDITERKKIELELIKAKDKAEESDKLKTAFLQNMSHEIRTPMNAIMGFSDLLADNFQNKEKLQKFSDVIRLRCNDLLHIIDDILDISKIESGQLNINLENCNVKELFIELFALFNEYKNRIEKQNLLLLFKEPESSIGVDLIIRTDKVKLNQILINLLSNAFKFTLEGSITCGYTIENDKLVFYVKDTGVGIPCDKHDLIFERFTQLNQISKQTVSGTGLGLSIVAGLVKLLGGNIWLESEVGKGTTFYFSILLDMVPGDNNTDEKVKIDRLIDFSTKKVLIVEDDYFNSMYLKEILNLFNLEILITDKGYEALEIAQKEHIDLILMDIRLPDISGYEATKLILQIKPETKIIAQTAYAALDEKEKVLNIGCIDYLSKPTKKGALISLIQKHITV